MKAKIILTGILIYILMSTCIAQQPCSIRGFTYQCFGSVLEVDPAQIPAGSTFTIRVAQGSNFDFNTQDLRVILQPVTATGLGFTAARLTGVQVVDSRTLRVSAPTDSTYIGMTATLTIFKYPEWEHAMATQTVTIVSPGGVMQGNDYGDAPDNMTAYFTGVMGRYPTLRDTGGAHVLNIGEEMIGTTVSAESDADDINDEDGVINLVDMDRDDRIFLFMLATAIPAPSVLSFDVSVAPDAPAVTRYVNVLIDFNQDGRWSGSANGREWVAMNMPVNVQPGTTQRISTNWFSWGGGAAIVSPVWIRIALTRERVDAQLPDGWDGSGEFEYGEIQDHWFAWDGSPPPRNFTNRSANNTIKCSDNTWGAWLVGMWKPGMICKDDCPLNFKCNAKCFCRPDKKQWHTECRNGKCIGVWGAGADQCWWDWECKHWDCEDGKCISVNTPGKDKCWWDMDCYHYECKGTECAKVDTPGKNQCLFDFDCYHMDCVGEKCKKVAGGGEDKCWTDEECATTTTTTTTSTTTTTRVVTPRCGDGFLSHKGVSGGGDEECDPNTGPGNNWDGAKEYPCDDGLDCVECKCIAPTTTTTTSTTTTTTLPDCDDLDMYDEQDDCEDDCDKPDYCKFHEGYDCWYCQDVQCSGELHEDPECDGDCDPYEDCVEYQDSGCYYCNRIPYCGDGILDYGEQCEEGIECSGPHECSECQCITDCGEYCGSVGSGYINTAGISSSYNCAGEGNDDSVLAMMLDEIMEDCYAVCGHGYFYSGASDTCCCTKTNKVACYDCPGQNPDCSSAMTLCQAGL